MIARFTFWVTVISGGWFLASAYAQTPHDRPWLLPQVPIVIDPYGANCIEWERLVKDTRVMAVVHKATEGMVADSMYKARANVAKQHGLLWGAYHLGRPGDPIAQADFFLNQIEGTGATFVAIDIEADDPSRFMSIADAGRFMEAVHDKIGRYPAVYVNHSVYEAISARYDRNSVYAKGPLWIARFRSQLGPQNKSVWDDYTLWQFSSQINCSTSINCLYRVPGTATDMDVNVFNGTAAEIRSLFH